MLHSQCLDASCQRLHPVGIEPVTSCHASLTRLHILLMYRVNHLLDILALHILLMYRVNYLLDILAWVGHSQHSLTSTVLPPLYRHRQCFTCFKYRICSVRFNLCVKFEESQSNIRNRLFEALPRHPAHSGVKITTRRYFTFNYDVIRGQQFHTFNHSAGQQFFTTQVSHHTCNHSAGQQFYTFNRSHLTGYSV